MLDKIFTKYLCALYYREPKCYRIGTTLLLIMLLFIMLIDFIPYPIKIIAGVFALIFLFLLDATSEK